MKLQLFPKQLNENLTGGPFSWLRHRVCKIVQHVHGKGERHEN
jgi:hypothetical protein